MKRIATLLVFSAVALLTTNVSYADGSPPKYETQKEAVVKAAPAIEVTNPSFELVNIQFEDVNAGTSVTVYEEPRAAVIPLAPVTSFSEFRDPVVIKYLALLTKRNTAASDRSGRPPLYPEIGYGLAYWR